MKPGYPIVLAMLLSGMGSVPALARDTASLPLAEFAWRAPLVLPDGAPAAQLRLPAEAMLQLRSATGQDVRVFNAQGESVAITRIAPALPAPAAAEQTASFAALPLFVSTQAQAPDSSSVRVQMDAADHQATVWVRLPNKPGTPTDDNPAAGTRRLPAVLFDTRSEKRRITALHVDATMPANSLITLAVSVSTDLVRWTSVPVKGPLFRFDGAGAPDNQVLEFQQALLLQDHYLRLQWNDATAVRVHAASGQLALARPPPDPVSANLSDPVAEGSQSLTWPIRFAVPMAALKLQTTRANTLVPVRVLGRNDTSQPWRQMAQGVIFRIGAAGQERTNAAIPLHGASTRWLRVEATHGMALPASELRAEAQFNPIQLVFLASGAAPFELAVGRPDTPSAMVDASMLRAVVSGRLDTLPLAALGPGRTQDIAPWNESLMRLMPGNGEQRKLILWLVLAVGVLVLGAVAFAMLRQLSARPASDNGRD